MMIGFANGDTEPPKYFEELRSIGQNKNDDYFDVKLFSRHKTETIVMQKDEIDRSFYFTPDSKKVYNQYIGVPVYCNDNKLVGLLQVVSYGDSRIGNTNKDLKDIAKRYLKVIAYGCLQMHKTEKLLYAIPTVQVINVKEEK